MAIQRRSGTQTYPLNMLMHSPFIARSFLLTIPRLLPTKAAATLQHLEERGICAEPFLGLDGEISGLETKWTYDIDHPGSGYRMGHKVISMYIGHLMIYQACQLLPGDNFLIMEDDARFDPGWREHFDFAIDSLPPDWDLLFFGSCCTGGRKNTVVKGRLHATNYVLCTHAYAIRKKAIPTLLDGCHKIYANIDIALCLHCIPRLKTFVFLPRLAEQLDTIITP